MKIIQISIVKEWIKKYHLTFLRKFKIKNNINNLKKS